MDEDCTGTNGEREARDTGHLRRTARTEVRRARDRGSHDRALAEQILDEGLVCHVGFNGPEGAPVVLPMTYARDAGTLVLHGSRANRMLRTLAGGGEVCATITILDGLVVARSAFHMSMNYRSVVLFGRATPVEEAREQRRLTDLIVDHSVPGHRSELRPPSRRELATTLVLTLPLDEASVKVRRGGPVDDPEDLQRPVWAGEVPLRLTADAPVPDDHARARGLAAPTHLAALARPSASPPAPSERHGSDDG